MPLRVAIIGAGPCGMSLMHAFQKEAEKGHEIPEIVCFEKQSGMGGMWRYSWRTSFDEHGEPLHNCMYRQLWSNGPKEGLEFADYSFDEHFKGKQLGSFPPREILLDYILGRAEKGNLVRWVSFNTVVRHVTYNSVNGNFTVEFVNYDGNSVRRTGEETFDYVVVANGHYNTPNLPNFEGLDTFPGRVLHSKAFRDAREFAGKDVLVVGLSYSAEDLASMCYKHGCKSVTISYRSLRLEVTWPDSFALVPILTRVEGKTAVFKDGTRKDVDVIMLCTGYHHNYPFLGDDLNLETKNRLWPDGLFKGVISMKNEKLIFLGMQYVIYANTMFDIQAWYARDYILGKIKLPPREELQREFDAWRKKENKITCEEDRLLFQGTFVRSLLALSDYPRFDTEGVEQALKTWAGQKMQNMMTYRDQVHKSGVTGIMARPHKKPWLEEMDDSLQNYVY